MNKFRISALILFLVGIMIVSTVSAMPTINELEINGHGVDPLGQETLKVELGETLEIGLELEANDQDYKDLRIRAEIGGYEHSDITDVTSIFDLDMGDKDYQDLSVTLPNRMDKEDGYYQLRILVYDKNSNLYDNYYELHLKGDRHSVAIRDVVLSPEAGVEAGRSLLATMRVENIGERDEDGVKVSLAIPELGISASDYIDELEEEEKTTSEELYLRIPVTAAAGTYQADACVSYNNGFDQSCEKVNVKVKEAIVKVDLPATSVAVKADSKTIVKGEGGALYELTIVNGEDAAKTFRISADDISEWGQAEVRPDNVVSIASGASKSVLIYVQADKSAAEGAHDLAVTVEAGDISEIVTLNANVVSDSNSGNGWKTGLIIALIVLVIILVILGLVIGFGKLKGNDEENFEESQTYY